MQQGAVAECHDCQQGEGVAPPTVSTFVLPRNYFDPVQASRCVCDVPCLISIKTAIHWKVVTFRADGQRQTRGGACVTVGFSPDCDRDSFWRHDNRDGTYSIRSRTGFRFPGHRWLVIQVNGEHIAGSPFVITLGDAPTETLQEYCRALQTLPGRARVMVFDYLGVELLRAKR